MNIRVLILAAALQAGCTTIGGSTEPIPTGPDGGGLGSPDAGGDDGLAAQVTIAPATFELEPGADLALTATVRDRAGGPILGATIGWQSSDPAIATVSATGTVVAVAAGTVQITARVGGVSGLAAGTIALATPALADPDPSCCQDAIDNFCSLPPGTAGCPMTAPGGYCDPDGDGSYDEPGDDASNWITGYQHFAAFCPTAPPAAACCAPGVDNFCLIGVGVDGCAMTQAGGYCDPDGDGSFTDGDWVRGYDDYQATCD